MALLHTPIAHSLAALRPRSSQPLPERCHQRHNPTTPMAAAASLAVSHHRLSGPSIRPQPRTPARGLRLPPPRPRLRAAASASSAPAERDHATAAAGLERCLAATLAPVSAPPEMKGGRRQDGAFGAVTLEKAKPDLTQRLKDAHPEVRDAFTSCLDSVVLFGLSSILALREMEGNFDAGVGLLVDI